MAGKTAILTLKILADAKDAQKGLDDTAQSAGKFQEGIGKAAAPAAAALGLLAAAGISAAKAAAEDQQSAALLAQTLRNTGSTDAAIAATEEWISKTSQAAAVADDELRPALATLTRATGDVDESQKAMGTALDVSAATGKDLGSVTDALAKAYAGQTTSLGKLVPGMDKAILASGDMDAIMAELARTTGGSAAEAANSAAGQWKGFQIQLGEAQEAIGGALLPVMTKLGGSLQGVAVWIQKNTTLFLVIAGVIGSLAAAVLILNVAYKAQVVISAAVATVQKVQQTALIGTRIQLAALAVQQTVVSAATKVWAAVQWLLNAAFLASPITWIIVGIIALIAAIVLIATKTTWFQDIWATVWGAIQAAAEAVWNWLVKAATTTFNAVASVVRAYVAIYVAIWNGLVAAVSAVWDWISNAVRSALTVIVGIVKFYVGLYVAAFEGIKSAIGAVWDWLKDAGKSALEAILIPVNAVKTAFDRVVDAIRSVIDWLGRIKVPDVIGKIGDALSSINPFSASASPASRSVGTPFTGGGPGARAFAAPSLSAAASSGGQPMIVVQGALDPVAVARQIRQILTTDSRRRSGVVIA